MTQFLSLNNRFSISTLWKYRRARPSRLFRSNPPPLASTTARRYPPEFHLGGHISPPELPSPALPSSPTPRATPVPPIVYPHKAVAPLMHYCLMLYYVRRDPPKVPSPDSAGAKPRGSQISSGCSAARQKPIRN